VHEVDLRIVVNPRGMVWPSEGEFRGWEKDGAMANHSFVDLRDLDREEAESILEDEWELVEAAAKEIASTPEEFLDRFDALERYDEYVSDHPELSGIDLGVASAVAALSVIGCAPFSSCAGHGGNAPHVVFYARRKHVAVLKAAARAGRAGLVNNDEGRLEVFGASIMIMLRFAEQLLARCWDRK